VANSALVKQYGDSNVANITHDANVPVTVKQYGHEVLTNITVTQK
jgi:hypothetical protein